MSVNASSAKSFSFTSRPEDCVLLDQALCVLRPNDHPSQDFGQAASQALVDVLSPQWDGRTHPKGMDFKARLITEACCRLIAKPDMGAPRADCILAVCQAIATFREDLGAPADSAFQKLINKTTMAMTEHFGYGSTTFGDGMAGSELMRSIIAVASPQQRSKLASRILPPWQREAEAGPFRDAGAIARVYAALFSHGVDLNDIFGAVATPTHSVAQLIALKLAKMPAGPVRLTLSAEFDRRSIAGALLTPLKRQTDPWESRGLHQDKMGALLGLVELLEQAHPGEGADIAMSLIRNHPSIQALESTAQDLVSPQTTKRLARI
jgi:hypothetical protein